MDKLKLVKLRFSALGMGEKFRPITGKSTTWKTWHLGETRTHCSYCLNNNGKVFLENDIPSPKPKVHEWCACIVDWITTIKAGTATIDGFAGVDALIYNSGQLPDNYVNKKVAKNHGWKKKLGNLQIVLPGSIMGGDIFENKEYLLPDALGRIWYEVDINYTFSKRGSDRLVYSDDGLVFVSYDHYETFCEIN